MGNIKLREADQIVRHILTDVWHEERFPKEVNEIYYEHQDGDDLYTVTLEGGGGDRRGGTLTITKITMGSGKGTLNLGSRKWLGTKDAMTDAARQWIFDTIKGG